jgi:hypothetical protein
VDCEVVKHTHHEPVEGKLIVKRIHNFFLLCFVFWFFNFFQNFFILFPFIFSLTVSANCINVAGVAMLVYKLAWRVGEFIVAWVKMFIQLSIR